MLPGRLAPPPFPDPGEVRAAYHRGDAGPRGGHVSLGVATADLVHQAAELVSVTDPGFDQFSSAAPIASAAVTAPSNSGPGSRRTAAHEPYRRAPCGT
jgi:hypothetical protein